MSLREDVVDMKKEVNELKEESFALEILKDYKNQNKRLFIIICILLGIIALFIGGIVYFVTNYDIGVENTTTELTGDGINNVDTNIDGDVINGN